VSAAVLSPQARRDLLFAIRWISKDNPAAARALGDAVIMAAGHIGNHRHFGALHPELAQPPYRFVTLTGFPYIFVYNADREPPLILRILHGARDLPEILRDIRSP
jgi:toxin ParE1/3/4